MAQSVKASHNKAPVKFASIKPILLRGLINCAHCGGTVSGDIKKQKYVYYSCHNSRRICAKKWFKEEQLLETLLGHFNEIQLSNEQIGEIVENLEEFEAQEHALMQKAQQQLQERLELAQERISKLIDMHIDGRIDPQTYHMKLEEYKREQHSVTVEIKSYSGNNKAELIAAQEVLQLAQKAKDIFESSNWDEKQQLLRFFFSNLKLDREKLDAELQYPFNLIATVHDQHKWRS